jgi:hypothetical protein
MGKVPDNLISMGSVPAPKMDLDVNNLRDMWAHTGHFSPYDIGSAVYHLNGAAEYQSEAVQRHVEAMNEHGNEMLKIHSEKSVVDSDIIKADDESDDDDDGEEEDVDEQAEEVKKEEEKGRVYGESQQAEKSIGSILDDIIKGSGEGSRGGNVIGHTKSGKPIYAKGGSHQGFSSRDHLDAAEAHESKSSTVWKEGMTRDEMDDHAQASHMHMGEAEKAAQKETGKRHSASMNTSTGKAKVSPMADARRPAKDSGRSTNAPSLMSLLNNAKRSS